MAVQVAIIERMDDPDKDIRFMAASDCLRDLVNDSLKLDEDLERRLVRKLIGLLNDKNSEVQNQGVKCLTAIVTRARDASVQEIISKLMKLTLSSDEMERETGSMTLKNVVTQIDPHSALASTIARQITPEILARLDKPYAPNDPSDIPIRLELLDVLNELMRRHASALKQNHNVIEELLRKHLAFERATIRKRASNALAQLLSVCSPEIGRRTCDFIVKQLDEAASAEAHQPASEKTRSYVNCVAAMARAMPAARIATYLDGLVPRILQYAQAYEQDEELAECAMIALEALLYKCPREMQPQLPEVLRVCMKAIVHDPNYQYDDDEDMTNGDAMDASDNDSVISDEPEYSDDEDVSWKVRRAAAKCLDAVVNTQRQHLTELYANLAPLLIQRLKEREDNVKTEIFTVMLSLLKQTRLALPQAHVLSTTASLSVPHAGIHTAASVAGPLLTRIHSVSTAVDRLSNEERQLYDHVLQMKPALMRAVQRQLNDKQVRTRQQCFAIFDGLVHIMPDAFAQNMPMLLSALTAALAPGARVTSVKLKMDVLAFLTNALAAHQPQVFCAYASQLVPLVIGCVNDQHKVSQEALNAAHALILVLRPLKADGTLPPLDAQSAQQAVAIYQVVSTNLQSPQIDHEVRERSIACMAQLLAQCGDVLKEGNEALKLLADKMKNEMMRLVTVKSFITIARSPLNVDVTEVLPQLCVLLADFLKKSQRSLKIATLELLKQLVTGNKPARQTLLESSSKLLEPVLAQLPAQLNENEVQAAYTTLCIVNEILAVRPEILQQGTLLVDIQRSALLLCHSAMIQRGDQALDALLQFWRLLATTQAAQKKESYQKLLTVITNPMLTGDFSTLATGSTERTQLQAMQSSNMSHQRAAAQNVAKVVAEVAIASGAQAAETTATSLATQLSQATACHRQGKKADERCEQKAVFYMCCIGELARRDPSTVAKLNPSIETLIADGFDTDSEHIKATASYALGCMAVGNLKTHLPFLLKEIENKPKQQYLLLHALLEVVDNETMSAQMVATFKPNINSVWEVLMKHAESGEEGTRNVVAECLGRLCLIDARTLVPRLANELQTQRATTVRTTIITAVKVIIREQAQYLKKGRNADEGSALDALLRERIPDLFKTLDESEEMKTRQQALVTLNTLAHNKAHLIRDFLPTIAPAVYRETHIRPELIREISMGPFTHKIDDGLELRKAAYECLYTLLLTCIERLDVNQFIGLVEEGLRDHHDIMLLTHLMFIRLVAVAHTQILQHLTPLIDALKVTLTAQPKSNAVKSECDKYDEARRSAMRCVVALLHAAGEERVQALIDLQAFVRANSELQALQSEIERDPTNRNLLSVGAVAVMTQGDAH